DVGGRVAVEPLGREEERVTGREPFLVVGVERLVAAAVGVVAQRREHLLGAGLLRHRPGRRLGGDRLGQRERLAVVGADQPAGAPRRARRALGVGDLVPVEPRDRRAAALRREGLHDTAQAQDRVVLALLQDGRLDAVLRRVVGAAVGGCRAGRSCATGHHGRSDTGQDDEPPSSHARYVWWERRALQPSRSHASRVMRTSTDCSERPPPEYTPFSGATSPYSRPRATTTWWSSAGVRLVGSNPTQSPTQYSTQACDSPDTG